MRGGRDTISGRRSLWRIAASPPDNNAVTPTPRLTPFYGAPHAGEPAVGSVQINGRDNICVLGAVGRIVERVALGGGWGRASELDGRFTRGLLWLRRNELVCLAQLPAASRKGVNSSPVRAAPIPLKGCIDPGTHWQIPASDISPPLAICPSRGAPP